MKTSSALNASTDAVRVGNYASRFRRVSLRPEPEPERASQASTRLVSQILAGFARGAAVTDMAPGAVIRSRVGEVLSLMQRARSGDALRRLAERKLVRRFDFKLATQLAVGAAWFTANSQQQRALENGFRDRLISAFTALLGSAPTGDMQLEVKPVRHSHANDVTVRTLIKRSGKPTLCIDYQMENQANGWKVYDVRVDGVSAITAYRKAFIEQVRHSGIDGLIAALNAKHRTAVPRHDVQHHAFI